MKLNPLVKGILTFFAAYLCLLLVFSRVGPYYFKAFEPLFTHQIEFLFPQFDVTEIKMEDYHGQQMISLTVALKENIILPDGTVLHTVGRTYTSKTISINQYLHPIILFSILLAWPRISRRDRFILFLFSLPFLVLVEMADIPLLLTNRTLETIQRTLYENPNYAKGVGSYWIAFLHTGGRAALSILAFGLAYGCLSILNFRKARKVSVEKASAPVPAKLPPEARKTGRNDPCPCGSGKKYKNCHGKR